MYTLYLYLYISNNSNNNNNNNNNNSIFMAKLDTKFCDPPFNDWRSSISSSSRQSYTTDEGYYSDDKQRISWMQEEYFDEDDEHLHKNDNNIS